MKIDTDKIRRWREERFWSQEHLAELAGIAPRTVQRIESGETASRDSIMALAAAFNVDARALTIDPEQEKSNASLQKLEKTSAGLRLAFFITLASVIFLLILFAGISLGDGNGIYELLWPSIWITVSAAGLGLVLVIIELIIRFEKAN